jgi:hypothetical protein
MADGFDAIMQAIDTWIAAHERHATAGLVIGMLQVEATAKATDAYHDVTGATRAGTVGYVAGVNEERFTEALQAVVEHNPLGLASETTPPIPDGVLVGIVIVPTSYQIGLEIDLAGKRAFLNDSLQQEAPAVFQAVVAALTRVV